MRVTATFTVPDGTDLTDLACRLAFDPEVTGITVRQAGWPCECGRVFDTRRGELTHGRACPVEQSRSAVFTGAVETGRDVFEALAEWRANGRPLQVQT